MHTHDKNTTTTIRNSIRYAGIFQGEDDDNGMVNCEQPTHLVHQKYNFHPFMRIYIEQSWHQYQTQ